MVSINTRLQEKNAYIEECFNLIESQDVSPELIFDLGVLQEHIDNRLIYNPNYSQKYRTQIVDRFKRLYTYVFPNREFTLGDLWIKEIWK